jgi:hypothetical protein
MGSGDFFSYINGKNIFFFEETKMIYIHTKPNASLAQGVPQRRKTETISVTKQWFKKQKQTLVETQA